MHTHTWNYKVIYLTSGLSSGAKEAERFEAQLTDLGMRGWELVTVTDGKQAFFKKMR